jgi:hypothetical protein
MGGGLLQLVAYGAQDVYLTGNPQITFFKVVYRRHTNFAIESINQSLNGSNKYGGSTTCTISRNGDLINRVYVQIEVPGLSYTGSGNGRIYVDYYGLKLLKNVTIEIGGQQIDKHYSDWMYIWNELSLPEGKKYGYDKMVGYDGNALSKVSNNNTTLYVPLEFWFCRNIGLALPLIALQYHEVKIKIDYANISEVCFDITTGPNVVDYDPTTNSSSDYATISDTLDINIWVDYIYLDTDERRKFAQLSHEYLIEQLQHTGPENYSPQMRLNLNHPCKELIWVSKWGDSTSVEKWNNYSHTGNINPFTSGQIKLNGNDRFSKRDGTYFDKVQPYQHHTNIPANGGINVYSFAIKPEEHQPSGTLNMSRIDSAVLVTEMPTSIKSVRGDVLLYAINYNVLRILSGMGGLAYSN